MSKLDIFLWISVNWHDMKRFQRSTTKYVEKNSKNYTTNTLWRFSE